MSQHEYAPRHGQQHYVRGAMVQHQRRTRPRASGVGELLAVPSPRTRRSGVRTPVPVPAGRNVAPGHALSWAGLGEQLRVGLDDRTVKRHRVQTFAHGSGASTLVFRIELVLDRATPVWVVVVQVSSRATQVSEVLRRAGWHLWPSPMAVLSSRPKARLHRHPAGKSVWASYRSTSAQSLTTSIVRVLKELVEDGDPGQVGLEVDAVGDLEAAQRHAARRSAWPSGFYAAHHHTVGTQCRACGTGLRVGESLDVQMGPQCVRHVREWAKRAGRRISEAEARAWVAVRDVPLHYWIEATPLNVWRDGLASGHLR
jgi:hypothetical protein